MGYAGTVHEHLSAVERHNADTVERAIDALLGAITSDGLIVTAGAGHSLAAVAETFYRAGGLSCVRPLYHPDLLPMHGAKSSTDAERRSGLAAEVLAEDPLDENDVLIVFSTSGVNPYPVELAKAGRAAGLPVIGVTSGPASAAAPKRAGTTLAAESSIVLDTLVPPGDAAHPAAAPVTAPLSSLSTMFVWNLLLVGLHTRAERDGIELPLWRSANTEGGDQANKDLLAHYGKRVPRLA
ncbi:sugar isomerase domain-containing protein [Allokutzneria oryzae]|uniref:Sugar isomerase domain-containing protein n=1 Tax=Allokutzneria oryzae TaxID=1378989 RepID=A0ABV5ZRA0_9PSEU